MKKYKLKKEARQFFNSKYHSMIETVSWWNDKTICAELLEEVPVVFVEVGRQASENNRNISQYDKNGALFEFTVSAPSLEHIDYEKMNLSNLTDEIQKVLDKHFKDKYF